MRTIALLSALVWALAGPAAQAAAAPVVVELYTAQGCSACAKANGLIDRLSARKGVLPLTFAVDYWDYLGWTDTFAKPEFTARQRTLMRRMAIREIFTPQVVVDGRSQAAGGQVARIDALVRDAAKSRGAAPRLSYYGGRWVRIEAGGAPRGGAEVWLVRYQPHPEPVEVKQGENRGETVGYANVVRELTRLGSWTGARRTFALPPADDPALKTVVLVQGVRGDGVLGVLQK